MFKQMTAYEMRISDLSSDVWSSDLGAYGQGSVCGRAVCALDVHEPALDASRGSFGRAAYGLAGVGPPVAQTRRSQGQASLSGRSEARRVGKECVSTCRSPGLPEHYKTQQLYTINRRLLDITI